MPSNHYSSAVSGLCKPDDGARLAMRGILGLSPGGAESWQANCVSEEVEPSCCFSVSL